MKYCKDCKHYRSRPLDHSRCSRGVEFCTDPVSGEKGIKVKTLQFCYAERESDEKNRCGPDAKFFEAKPTLLGKLKELMNKCKPS